MQHIIFVLGATYTLQKLHVFIPSTDLLCRYAKLFDKYSASIRWRCIIGRFFSLNSALEQLSIDA